VLPKTKKGFQRNAETLGIKWSGRQDLNLRPLVPQTYGRVLNSLVYRLYMGCSFYPVPCFLHIYHKSRRQKVLPEILRLKWQDVNFTKKTVTRWTRKRSSGAYEPITCHMNEGLYRLLKARWNNRKNEKYVYFNTKTNNRFKHRPKLMKGLCKRAKINPAFGFHNIRHFVATYLADAEKISKKSIGGLLGHKALQTTEIYLHSTPSSEVTALDKLYKKFGGKI